jgi:hypothetical protein
VPDLWDGWTDESRSEFLGQAVVFMTDARLFARL